MFHDPTQHQEALGTVLGHAPGQVAVYSCNYDQYDAGQYPDRHAFRHYLDGLYMGYKWQCVELARRWWYLNKGCIFADVAMAYDIFRLNSAREVATNQWRPLYAFANGCPRPPEAGSLLVWDEGGLFEETGHVAVITAIEHDRVYLVEQNFYNHKWPENQHYSRYLSVRRDEGQSFFIQSEAEDTCILGWVTLTDDASHACDVSQPNASGHRFHVKSAANTATEKQWLDQSEGDEKAYIRLNGHRLTNDRFFAQRYITISAALHREIKRATNDIHSMFLHATDHVLQNDAALARFNIPEIIWPRIKRSWANRNNETIAGRLDLAVTERGIKVFEYNADSASCLMECGKVQGRWAEASGVTEGLDAGQDIFNHLVHSWRKNNIRGCLHIMLDEDLEENYHAQYMARAAKTAGIRCKVLHGTEGLQWGEGHSVLDRDGERIERVWKTWAWETALDQIREQLAEDSETSLLALTRHEAAPRLADVLLNPQVMVHEPLWTLIPSNKAILPVLFELFPDSPYLLESRYQLTDSLRHSGYVEKPIVGRCGANIVLCDAREGIVEQTDGQFENQNRIYQALFPLPVLHEYYLQTNAFIIDGKYSGTCLRVDRSPIITGASDLPALRITP